MHQVTPASVLGRHLLEVRVRGRARPFRRQLVANAQAAIDAPRVFPETYGLRVEANLTDETKASLTDRGHKVVQTDDPIGGAQAIQIDHTAGMLIGGSDPRKDGIAIGY